MSTRKPFQVAIIGAGRFGSKRAAAVSRSPRCTLTVVADPNVQAAKVLADRFACRATGEWKSAVMREDVDVVVVSTPTYRLAEVSLLAAQAGKHILVEKPSGRSATEILPVIEAARISKVFVKAGYNHRYHRAIRRAYKLFKEGYVGRPLTVQCFYGHGGRIGYEREWRSQTDLSGGGQLLDQGVHVLDLLRWFLGDFEEVNAMISTAFWPIAPAEDNVFATLRAACGAVAQVHASWTCWKNKFSFSLFGEKGYLCVEGLGGSYGPEQLCLGVRGNPGEVPNEQWSHFEGRDDSLDLEWEDFLDSISGNHSPMSDGDEAMRTLLLVDAIYRAAKERRTIQAQTEKQSATAGAVQ